MDFEYDEVLDVFIATYQFEGATIEIRLATPRDEETQALGDNAIDHLNKNWPEIRRRVATLLLNEYNTRRSAEGDSHPQLTLEQLLQSLTPEMLEFDDYSDDAGAYILLFGDSGDFDGQIIRAVWEPHDFDGLEVTFIDKKTNG